MIWLNIMRKTAVYVILFLCSISIIGCKSQQELDIIVHLGWTPSKIPLEQIIIALKEYKTAEQCGFSLDLVSTAADVSAPEYLRKSNLDVFFAGEVEAAEVLASSGDWKIISRIAYHRIPIYVPADSPIQSIEELKGERIALVPGGLEHKYLNKLLSEANLRPERDVRYIEREESEIRELATQENRKEWGRIDALISADPSILRFEIENKIRPIKTAREVIVVLASTDFIETYPDRLPDLLTAFMDAHLQLAQHFTEASEWVVPDSEIRLSTKTFKIASSVEPNVRAMMKGHVSLHLSQVDREALQSTINFLVEKDVLEESIDIERGIDVSYLRKAEELWCAERDDYPMMK